MKRSERGFTLVEIMIVVAIIALLAAIAIPNVLRGRATANETAAVGNMRALLSSLEMYRSVNSAYPSDYGAQMTAGTLPFYPQPFSNNNANLAQVVQGFTYSYTPVAGGGTQYTLTAVPQNANTGSRAFFTNETGLVRHCSVVSGGDGTAEVDEPTIDQPPGNCD